MNENTSSTLFGFLLDNYLLAPALALVLLIASIWTASATLLVGAVITAYGWPLLYIYRRPQRENQTEEVSTAPAQRLNLTRAALLAAGSTR